MVRARSGHTFVSLFAGCGGLDLGFVEAGFRCVAAVDHDPIALATHRENFDDTTYQVDLTSSTPQLGSLKSVDVVTAGPPCQGFSTIGKRELHDPRNSLLVRAAQIAVQLRPRVILLENVPGALSGQHRTYWENAKNVLTTAGYRTSDAIVDAADYGVPQTRRRAVLLASRGHKTPDLPRPSQRRQTLRDVLSTGVASGISLLSGTQLLIARAIAPGQKLCNVRGGVRAVPTWEVPAVFGYTTGLERLMLEAIRRLRRQDRVRQSGDADPVPLSKLRRLFPKTLESTLSSLQEKGYVKLRGQTCDLTHTFNGKYRRLSWDAPSPTVDTRFGSPRYFLHPSENRGFSVTEAAAIQTFPENFTFVGSTAAQFRMIGNAVPPRLARRFALTIRDLL